LLPGISSPVRDGFPPRRFMSLSNALKSARLAVSKKLRCLQSRELFSHGGGDELVYACPIFLALSLYRPF
jgi:hypothetical protein